MLNNIKRKIFRTITRDEVLQKKSFNYDKLLKCVKKHRFSPEETCVNGRIYEKSYMGMFGSRPTWKYIPKPEINI